MAVAVRYAALSDIGLVRSSNQDSGYAGPHLLVVADGMGGHAGGDVASSLAIGELAGLDGQSLGGDTLSHLSAAVHAAHGELLQRVREEPALSGMGTTVTALLRSGNRLALAHIGDSRAYVLRDGLLTQITRDHTFVQTLVDDGRLTPEEAEIHPQRSVLIRVLSDVVDDVEPDLSMREARIGDRYLLCSDGLSGVVSLATLEDALGAGQDPATTCETLVQYARRAGAPDNVTCIVADVVDDSQGVETTPFVVGAATSQRNHRVAGTSPAERAAELTSPRPRSSEVHGHPDGQEEASSDDGQPSRGRTGRVLRRSLFAAVVALVVVGGVFGAHRWVQGQVYVGSSAGQVAIFKGLPQDLGPISLSSVDTLEPDVQVTALPAYSRERLDNGIVADDHSAAEAIVQTLREQAAACAGVSSSTPGTTPSATATGSPSATTTPGVTSSAASATSPTSSPTTSPTNPTGAPQGCEGID